MSAALHRAPSGLSQLRVVQLVSSSAVLQVAEESLLERSEEVRVARVESALRALRQTESLAALLPAALSARSLCCLLHQRRCK